MAVFTMSNANMVMVIKQLGELYEVHSENCVIFTSVNYNEAVHFVERCFL